MCRFALLAPVLACLALPGPRARAETPASPLRLVPDQADLLIQVHSPRQFTEGLLALEGVKEIEKLPFAQEFFRSTQYRRFQQLIAYYEKELGARWPELLDQLAGGGMVLAIKFGPNPAPALIIIQGTDADQVKKFSDLTLTVIEQELARQEARVRPEKGTYNGVPTLSIGKEFHLARAGSALIFSNKPQALHAALDLHTGKKKDTILGLASVKQASKLLPQKPLASLWVNMRTVQKSPQAKQLYKTPRDNPAVTVLFGSYLDILGRTPYVCAGLYPEQGGYLFTIRTPRGREGMGPEHVFHLPPPGQPTSLPLLNPREVIYSESFYLDLAKLWTERKTLLTEQQAGALERFNNNSGRFLAGVKMNKLLEWSGPYHRIVVVNQAKVGYNRTPKTRIPAFAFVTQLREPERFHRAIGTVLRGAALLAGTQVKLTLVEEKHAGCDIVGYRFPEDGELKQDTNDIRFNFSPCFTRVGNQFILCSTLDLCRELIDLLQEEAKKPIPETTTRTRSRFHAAGVAALLTDLEDQLITQTILNQAVPPDEAKEQVKAFLALLRHLGTVTLEGQFQDNEFHLDFRYHPGK
jgi:hypothetical protein